MVQLFASSVAAAVFYPVLWLWLLSEVIGAGVIPRARRRGARIERNDKGSHPLILMNIFMSIIITFSFAASGVAMLPNWVFYLGIVLIVLRIVLRQWSIAVLRSFFSNMIGVQKGQKVVDKDPCHLVRHPAYTGGLLTF